MWSILQRIFLSKDSINLSIELKGRSVKITDNGSLIEE